MASRVGVVGAGAWGTTLAKLLADNGQEVLLWARQSASCEAINAKHENGRYLPEVRLPAQVVATTDLRDLCERCLLVLVAVPSRGFRDVARELGRFLRGDHLVIHGTKGFEQSGCKRMSEVLREETCVRKIGVLSGPNLAREVALGKPAGTLVASKFDEVVTAAQAALHSRQFLVYGGTDVAGAEVGGAFKNVVAVAAGVVDGLQLGDNAKSLLIARSLTEMSRVGEAMGADRSTFWGLSGIGDLVATCASPLSRNHQVGERLARGESRQAIEESMVAVAEGVPAARALFDFATGLRLDLPIVGAVHRVLYEGLKVEDVLRRLMARPAGPEFERGRNP
jgi:glycerol-3-phosphate dehydrogenase (NAD(P)+)